MYRAGVWPQRHLFLPLVPFSVRMRSAGADRRGVLADKVALITGSTDGYSEILISQLYPYSRFLFQPKTTECVDRAVERLQGEGLSASGTVCHVGKEEDCKRLALGPYNVSKTALLGLTRTLSLELAPKGIQVNCLAPGVMKTMFSQVVRIWSSSP
uniref:Dehydrogenase/reductase 2 n=1 Tax=Vombatus ursinus TaxID=29139 RepID=A0A4X2LZX8_VOMUR